MFIPASNLISMIVSTLTKTVASCSTTCSVRGHVPRSAIVLSYFLDSDGPVDLELPEQWLWDIIDEFIYQYQVFCTWRSKVSTKTQDELMMLAEGGPVRRSAPFADFFFNSVGLELVQCLKRSVLPDAEVQDQRIYFSSTGRKIDGGHCVRHSMTICVLCNLICISLSARLLANMVSGHYTECLVTSALSVCCACMCI